MGVFDPPTKSSGPQVQDTNKRALWLSLLTTQRELSGRGTRRQSPGASELRRQDWDWEGWGDHCSQGRDRRGESCLSTEPEMQLDSCPVFGWGLIITRTSENHPRLGKKPPERIRGTILRPRIEPRTVPVPTNESGKINDSYNID